MRSKYYTTWEEYKEKHPELADKPEEVVAPKIQKYEDLVFNFVLDLVM